MSAKPREEPGSEGRWFAEDFETIGRVDSPVPRFDEPGDVPQLKSWEDKTFAEKQFYHQPDSDRKRPPVAMETASTGGTASDLLSKSSGEGDLYTSLLSSQTYSFQQDTPSFAKDPAHLAGPPPSREPQGMFSSDSGIGMTPGEGIDFTKNLLESEKMEAYNYMDISHGEKPRIPPQQQGLDSWGRTGLDSFPSLGQYLEKSAPAAAGDLGPALEEQACPYVEDPSDEELSDQQPYRPQATPQAASPVKITLTESTGGESLQHPHHVAVSDRESILSLGLQGVPTVTLSEPEDDSPGSLTPPLTEESDSPSEPLFQTNRAGPVSSPRDQVSATAPPLASAPTHPSPPSEKGVKIPDTPAPSKMAASQDQDGSSAESGDSEIELVSEEPPPRKQPPSAGYMSFGLAGSPSPAAPAPPAPPAPSIQYSILREEREAELDSELIIESFDASSASEESPKRGLDSPAQKGPKTGSQPADAPSVSASHASPSPLAAAPPATAPVSMQKEKSQVSGHVGEDPTARPKPLPAAVVPPEVRLEQPAPEEKAGLKGRASEAKGDADQQAALPALLQGLNRQRAMDLLYWRDVKQTGAVLGSLLLLLFSLTQFSVVSVVAYLALAALSATISFRVYKSVLQAVQKTDEGHPFKSYLESEICLSQEQMQNYAEKTQYYINSTLKELRKLFLVQDLVDSLKFAVLMWLLTYVGALFNGLTLLILAVVSMFSVPVVYEKYQTQIDQYLGLVRTHVSCVVAKIQEKVPGAKRKAE
ncbi:reticulon-1-like isoform X1 [Megalops cyprinoides]|uniref:reticulon-1-like isoform X1 n=1 Tax=Megalops cyprinoides TaxID=118141 RepID=UPI00186443E1|nr:reticulon-1-like isoform X1 [Megalops cyprinoides]